MVMTRWDRLGFDWPARWRRMLDLDPEPDGWLRIEEVHEDGTLVVRAELPGVDPEKDVEVSVSDGVLHIRARRESRERQEHERGYRSEFHYGELRRDLVLPAGVDGASIRADYDSGILEVRVPWPPEPDASTTKIPISISRH